MAGRSSAKAVTTTRIDDLDVTITRKNVKTLRMRVAADGSVRVSAPWLTPSLAVVAFVRSRRAWIEQMRAQQAAKPSGQAKGASDAEVARWKTAVKARTPELVAKYERLMGVKINRIEYRNMSTRWGSCTPTTGRISINVRLALYPPECLEYVVVHELCHMKEANHSARFYALVERYYPDWRRVRALLR